MKMKKNRLWASQTSSETLALAEKYKHFRATSRHILVIAPKKPKDFVEVKGELLDRLPADDVEWINAESIAIWEEEKETYKDELLQYAKEFNARFEAELKKTAAEVEKTKEGLTDAGTGDQAPTE